MSVSLQGNYDRPHFLVFHRVYYLCLFSACAPINIKNFGAVEGTDRDGSLAEDLTLEDIAATGVKVERCSIYWSVNET